MFCILCHPLGCIVPYMPCLLVSHPCCYSWIFSRLSLHILHPGSCLLWWTLTSISALISASQWSVLSMSATSCIFLWHIPCMGLSFQDDFWSFCSYKFTKHFITWGHFSNVVLVHCCFFFLLTSPQPTSFCFMYNLRMLEECGSVSQCLIHSIGIQLFLQLMVAPFSNM